MDHWQSLKSSWKEPELIVVGVTDVHRLMSSRQLRDITTHLTHTETHQLLLLATSCYSLDYASIIWSTLWHIIGTFIHQGASLRNKTNSPSETRTMYISLCDALETQ